MSYGINDAKALIACVSDIVEAHKDELNELDGRSGDGDLGMSVALGLAATKASVEAYEGDDLGKMLAGAAMACNREAPSTMGTLVSSGIMAIGKSLRGKAEIEEADVVAIPRTFADAIAARGGAKLGDKTILDALYPMADVLEARASSGDSLAEAFVAASAKAREAAEATSGIQASVGRAKWLGERASANPDGGAILCAVVAEGLAERAR